ncbi:MAG: iron-containing alcohol dehydrogenase [Promethearchaeota archaeon]
MWDITSPRKVIFGEDALEFLSDQSFNHAFIVTDPKMRELHFTKLEDQLKKTNTKITVFDDIPKEPTFKNVQEGVKILSEIKPDVIIALGGGSVMDAAKGMWPMYANPDEGIYAIEGLDPVGKLNLREKTGCILITIPTTSGTGSDATWATVLTDESSTTDRKASFGNRELVADIIILDPIFTETMPIDLLVGTAFDAMCHAIDGYLSTFRNDFSDGLVRHAFKLLWENLPIAFEQAKKGKVNYETREKLHNAATMAGWGFGNSQIIIAHSLAHSVGSIFELPHSLVIGPACWYSLMFNREVETQRIADCARLAGLPGSSNEELADKLIDAFKELLIKLEMPVSLKDMKISKEQYKAKREILIEYALNDSGSISNPVIPEYEDFERIFERFYAGSEL